MAIAQHQFYLDRKTPKSKEGSLIRDPLDLAGELSRSCLSLSTHSSPNLSRSGSHSSLQQNSHTDSVSTESLHVAKMEMLAALQQRYDAVQEKLTGKTEELKLLCLREGELTGELPPEYPLKPGEPPPTVRKRVGTSFTLDENLICKIINKQEENVASLELEREIQAKIASAALRLANDSSSRKGLRKQRKNYYHQAFQRLKDIELKLTAAKNRQAQIIANNSSTIPKMKKKPRPVSDGDGIQDDSYIMSSFNSQDCLKETSFIDGIALSPTVGNHSHVTPHTNLSSSPLKPKISTLMLHSAPPSPQRASSLAPASHSESSSSQPTISEDSRSSSPARPTSGYIPSCVYTLSQYRAQQYPTLSTRGHSVPNDGGFHTQRSYTEIPNLPQERNSLVSYSLDDLDATNPHSPTLHNLKSPTTPHPMSPQNNVTPPNNVANSGPSQQYNFHHHHYNHHHHTRRLKTDSQDRYGSLDRRRATSCRLESRSMEHLDAVTPTTPSSRQPTTQGHNHHLTPPIAAHHPHSHPHHLLEYAYHYEPREGQVYPTPPSIPNHRFESALSDFPLDTVDSTQVTYNNTKNNLKADSSILASDKYANRISIDSESPNNGPPYPTKLSRSTSARGFMDNGVFSPHLAYNQENIPPPPADPVHRTTYHRQSSKSENQTSLRPTSSINAADSLRPFRIPASDLPPLRATRSSVDLPPLKPTNGRIESPLYTESNPRPFHTPRLAHNDSFSTVSSSTPNSSRLVNGNTNPPTLEEPLISLAEAARLKKLQSDNRGRELSESHCSPPAMEKNGEAYKEHTAEPKTSLTAHNLSMSSIGSSGSNSSVFHSTNEGNDSLNSSLNATLTIESPSNHMVITTGTFQPPREVSKPFEMSDFYKYSTRFRKSSSQIGTNSDASSGSDSPMSPASLKRPPQHMVSNKSLNNSKIFAPPSPSLVARNSCPAPQQKGIYQPLSPQTCQPLGANSPGNPDSQMSDGSSSNSASQESSWENSPLHQAVPINVTTKRSATLV